MTKPAIIAFSAAFLVTACQVSDKPANGAADAHGTAAADSGADEQAIRGLVDRWGQLVKAKDAASIAQLYADDGALMPPNTPIGKGRDAIQKAWADMMTMPGFDLGIMPEQIIVSSSGDMALDRGTYKLAMSPGGKPVNDTGKYVVVWRKIGGEWKAAADIFNSDGPPAGA